MRNLKLGKKDNYRCYADLKTPVGKYKHLEINVEYFIGGYNYFSGNHNPRAYRLSFKPCNFSGAFTESTLLGKNQKEQGYYMLIEKANRFSSKRLAELASYIDPFIDKLTDAYIADDYNVMKEVIAICEPKTFKEKEVVLSTVNDCKIERPVNDPYEVWIGAPTKALDWTWKVLKKYESPADETKNPQARWLCAVYSPITREQCQPEGYEIGDVYVKDIKENAIKIKGGEKID